MSSLVAQAPVSMKSRVLHEFAKWIVSPVRLRIRGGPLAGSRWILSTGKHFIAGTYEPEKTHCIVAAAQPGMAVLDVGAHVGYFALMMAERVTSGGVVHAFEPRDLNRHFLQTHVRINGITNVRVHSHCLGDRVGPAKFNTRTGTGTGHLSSDGNVSVEMMTIDSLVEDGTIPVPDLIKIDVEGAEVLVLRGGYSMICGRRPTMILAVHSEALERECRAILEPLGYEFQDLHQAKGDREFLVRQGDGDASPITPRKETIWLTQPKTPSE